MELKKQEQKPFIKKSIKLNWTQRYDRRRYKLNIGGFKDKIKANGKARLEKVRYLRKIQPEKLMYLVGWYE